MNPPGRNDPCPCGSGKKYKKCCSPNAGEANILPPAGQTANASVARDSVPAPRQQLMQAVALHQAGRLDEAAALYQALLESNPQDSNALYYSGIIALQQNRRADAIRLIQSAVRLAPQIAAFHCNLGNAYMADGQLESAIAAFREAVRLDPNYFLAYSNLGNALKDHGLLEESLACHRKAVQLNPGFAGAYNNLGTALWAHGEMNEAAENLRRALALQPGYAEAYSNLLYLYAATRIVPPETEREAALGWEKAALDDRERQAARAQDAVFRSQPHFVSRTGRKLRLGIVSAELGQHPVAEFLEPFMERLDRDRFHLTLYPSTTRTEPRAERIKKLADAYTPLTHLGDAQAADRIRADRIDILLDTTGHMPSCRLGIFARRAAPVQCHYIGYHGTTGLTEMDWLISDEELLPPACDAHFCEKIWRLPRLRIAYRGDDTLPEGRWRPAADGVIWLGSLNNLSKVREEALDLWAAVMRELPESRLLLKDSKNRDMSVQHRILSAFASRGVSGERIAFAPLTPDWRAHMALYDRLDISLDTLPLNSETTAFDALWMGVPIVALEGDWYGARMTSTVLKALGRPEWVASGKAEFVAKLAALARDVAGRTSLRATQRTLMKNSPLCDAQGLARTLESAFEAMFDRWRTQKPNR
jgi:protein O-GlcNAc transferase